MFQGTKENQICEMGGKLHPTLDLEEYKKYLETVVIEKPYAFFCTNCSFKWVFGLDADIHSQTSRHKVIYEDQAVESNFEK